MTAKHSSDDLSAPAAVRPVRALLHAELSSRARFGLVALLLASTAMTVTIGSLLATEPALPARTQAAFAVLVTIGLGWMVYATWVLRTRRVLLGWHRVVAARMAVAFTSVFVCGAVAVAVGTGHPGGYAAAMFGAAQVAVAAALLVRARRDVARLTARRDGIEALLNGR